MISSNLPSSEIDLRIRALSFTGNVLFTVCSIRRFVVSLTRIASLTYYFNRRDKLTALGLSDVEAGLTPGGSYSCYSSKRVHSNPGMWFACGQAGTELQLFQRASQPTHHRSLASDQPFNMLHTGGVYMTTSNFPGPLSVKFSSRDYCAITLKIDRFNVWQWRWKQ